MHIYTHPCIDICMDAFITAHISIVYTQVGNNCPALAEQNPGLKNLLVGVFGLPFALFMTVVTGAELFTGNTAVLTAAGKLH
jgi:formate/nitrite transporter FocA (FNT family)